MDKQAFRRGFLYGLAAQGLTPEQFGNQIMASEKQASFLGMLGQAGDLTTAGLVGAPIAIGALGGHLAANLTAPNYNTSVQKMKDQEQLRQLRLATRRLNRSVIGPQQTSPTTEPRALSYQQTPAGSSQQPAPVGGNEPLGF